MLVGKYLGYLILPLLLLPAVFLAAQESKALSHEDLATWKRIRDEQLSANGRWVSYLLQGEIGDPELYLYDGYNDSTRSFDRADNAQISADNRFLIFMLHPAETRLKDLRRSGTKKEDLPTDTLAILDLNSGNLTRIPDVADYQMPRKRSDWLHYEKQVEVDGKRKNSSILLQLSTNASTELGATQSWSWAEEEVGAVFAKEASDSLLSAGVYVLDAEAAAVKPIWEQKGSYPVTAMEEEADQVAFLVSTDTTLDDPTAFALYHWASDDTQATLMADVDYDFKSPGMSISQHDGLRFSQDGSRVFFGIAPEPIQQDTNLLDEEIVQVEVWTYQDRKIYPRQNVDLKEDRRQTYTCVLHTSDGLITQLASPELPEIELGNEGNAPYVLVYDGRPYEKEISWEGGPNRKDVYLMNTRTEEKQVIATGLAGYPNFSPLAEYVYWYSYPDTAWMVYQVERQKIQQLTTNEEVAYYDELNDRPMHPRPYGTAGWTTDDDFILIYDRYDVWLIDPLKKLGDNNLTNNRSKRRVTRLIKTDPDERSIEEVKPMLFHFFDEESKDEGYLRFNIHTGVKNILEQGPYSYSRRPEKAKDGNRWLFTRESYTTFPNLLYGKDLSEYQQISDANPQQSEYAWGEMELYEWTSASGEQLQGLLVKPDNFDPKRKYPMIVNFYERSSDGIHRHRTPSVGRSTINYPFYAGRDYIIFNPDVPYKVGYPGESAYNSVVSGVSSLIDKGFVDRERIGLQGHSWGGYQVAHLITKTDMFRCAESGAPVVNMTSAYGGIRWGSGRSRMFQYERTQSRIGGTLWEKPMLYLENSPLFNLDRVNTPVLILHNDEDGAVPWYQGIEFFMAMRRLNKPAWMLNYNGEPHWPVKLQNRRDFQLRMQQFFDYYLRDQPMPAWMQEGVPAIEKGIDQNLELLDADSKH